MFRVLLVSPVAVLITLSLFWLMNYLIIVNRPDFKGLNSASTLDFIRLKREEQETKIKKRPEPPKKEKPQDLPPPAPVMQMAAPTLQPLAPPAVMDIPTIEVAPVNVKFAPMLNNVKMLKVAPRPVQVKQQAIVRKAQVKRPVKAKPQARSHPQQAVVSKKPAKPTSQGKGKGSGLTPLVRVEPRYPVRARQDGIEGWVKLGFTVSANGSVKDVKVISSKPRKVFDKAARKALKRWKFKAVVVNGKAVARRAEQVMQFKLK